MALRQGCRSSLFDPVFHRFLPMISNPLIRTELQIAGRRMALQYPSNPDMILQQSLSQHQDPYWGRLWEAASPLAHLILSSAWPRPCSCLELGCGTGLAGIAALLAGLHVTFSDLIPDAVLLAVSNAALNGFSDVQGQVLDWRGPLPAETFDVLLASDVLYDTTLHVPLLRVLKELLHHSGHVWIGDPGREPAREFLHRATDDGWRIRIRNAAGQELLQPQRSHFQLIELTRGA